MGQSTIKKLLDWKGIAMIEIKNLIEDYRKSKPEQMKKAEFLTFTGVGTKDVYNITAPFELAGEVVLAGRVEARESEESTVYLFRETAKNTWAKISDGIELPLQDPFYTVIDGQVILGGVEVVFLPEGQAQWRTIFYHLEDTATAHHLFEGPWGMKDLRLKQLSTGEILVMTRPQGEKGGRGKIGACLIDQLADLSIQKIEEAPLLANQFSEEEWGGANEIFEIDGVIWVLGHIANFDEQGDRHYYAMRFSFDRRNHAMKDVRILAERKDFAKGPTKRPDLVDVVFSGGLDLSSEHGVLYAGISDAGAQKLKIENPFK